MLNYSRALRNDVGVWSKSFLCAQLTAPLCEATIGIFSHCANINFATFLLQTGGLPASLNTHHTFSFLVTLLLLPFFCAFPHSLFYIPSAENRPSNIRLEVPTSWHKQTQKSKQNKLSHFCIICALISESKARLLTNEKWRGFLHDKLFPNKSYPTVTQSLPCLVWDCLVHGKKFQETHLHLLLRVLKMKDFPFYEWPAFLAGPLLTGSKLLHSS